MGSTTSSSAATYGQQVVAAVLMAEAWGEGKEAMIAVAEVIRTRADRWKISPLAVVKRPRHFSCLNNRTPPELVRKFHHEPDFQVALNISRTMYNEPKKLPNYSRGATHFDQISNRPYWIRGHKPVTIIGKLGFYRLRL